MGSPRADRSSLLRHCCAVALVASLSLACGNEARRPPAVTERIDTRLLDHLDQVRVSLGDLPPDAAEPTDQVLLQRQPNEPLAAPWVALSANNRQPRGELRDDQELLLTESACAIVPTEPYQDLLLSARMAPDQTVEAPGPHRQRWAGRPVVVELDVLPPSAAVGCELPYLMRHSLMPRQADPEPIEGSELQSHEIAFTTMPHTRAVAVVLATGMLLDFGLITAVTEQAEATARVGEVRFVRRGAEGITRQQFLEQSPPDPLLPDDPQRLRVKPSLAHQVRDSVLAPPGTTLCWQVDLPTNGALRFAIGVAWHASVSPGRDVRFRARVGEQEIFSETRRIGQRGWVDRRAPIPAELQGRQEVCLETSAEEGTGTIWSLWGAPEVTSRTERRDDDLPQTVILVSVDTLRAESLGVYGCETPNSPIIDALAAESMVFDNHVAQTGWTLPSHVSMLTGLTPEAHGVTGQMDRILDLLDVGFDPSVPTLAAALRQAGYSTHGIVSAPYLDPTFGFDRGFDSYDASTISPHMRSHSDITMPQLTRLSRQLIGRSGARPLFLFLHIWDVHYDYIPPREDLAAVHPDRALQNIDYAETRHPYTRHVDPALVRLIMEAGMERPPPEFYGRLRQLLPRYPRIREFMSLQADLYDGEVRTVDRQLEQLISELRRLGRLDDAVIVITSDHGEAFMEHGALAHGVDSIHREGLIVPLIIRAPGRVDPGRITEPSMTIDMPATLLGLLGLEPMPGSQGRNILERSGPGNPVAVGHDGTFSRFQATQGNLRLLTWGYFGPDQLFDIEADPTEMNDIGNERLQERTELRRAVARYLLLNSRGLHVAVVGDDEPGDVEITLRSDAPLRPFFAYGPPGTGDLQWRAEQQGAMLRANPGPGEVVALAVLIPDGAEVSFSVRAGDQDLPAEQVLLGRGTPRQESDTADESWQLPANTLPSSLGEQPGTVHLWRTPAFTVRTPLTPQEETLQQLRALGYLRD